MCQTLVSHLKAIALISSHHTEVHMSTIMLPLSAVVLTMPHTYFHQQRSICRIYVAMLICMYLSTLYLNWWINYNTTSVWLSIATMFGKDEWTADGKLWKDGLCLVLCSLFGISEMLIFNRGIFSPTVVTNLTDLSIFVVVFFSRYVLYIMYMHN